MDIYREWREKSFVKTDQPILWQDASKSLVMLTSKIYLIVPKFVNKLVLYYTIKKKNSNYCHLWLFRKMEDDISTSYLKNKVYMNWK